MQREQRSSRSTGSTSAGPGERCHLLEHIAPADQHAPAAGQLAVAGEQNPALGGPEAEERRVLVRAARAELGRREGVVAHEPEVPDERPEHPVHEEPRLLEGRGP